MADDGIRFLLGPFKASRAVDPGDWDSKMLHWSAAIDAWWEARPATACATVGRLSRDLAVDGVAPECLERVLWQMLDDDRVRRRSTVVRAASVGGKPAGKGLASTPSLVFDGLFSPLRWAWKAVNSPARAPQPVSHRLADDEQLVHTARLRDAADKIAERLAVGVDSCIVDRAVPLADVHAAAGDLAPSDVRMAVGMLVMDGVVRPLALPASAGGALDGVWLGGAGDNETLAATASHVLHVKTARSKVAKTVAAMRERMADMRATALAARRAGDEQGARASMRRLCALREPVERLTSQQDMMDQVLDKLRTAETDAAVVQAYRLGAVALRATVGDVDEAHDAVDDLEELLADAEALSSHVETLGRAGSGGGSSATDADEEALLAELEALSLQVEREDAQQDTEARAPGSADSAMADTGHGKTKARTRVPSST